MDGFFASFGRQMSKLENSLSDVRKEIITTTTYLRVLQNHSIDIVKKLRNVPSPSAFLKQFADVNSLLLKYLAFLTEINCKFEILQLSGSHSSDSIPIREFYNDLDLCFDLKQPVMSLLPIEGLRITEVTTDDGQSSNASFSPKSETDTKSDFTEISDDKPESQPVISEEKECEGDKNQENKFTASIENVNDNGTTNGKVEKFVEETDSETVDAFKNGSVNGDEAIKKKDSTPKRSNDDVKNKVPPPSDSKNIETTNVKSRSIGEEYEVVIEHIKSPSEFYIHYTSDLHLLKDLENKLKTIPANSERCWTKTQHIKNAQLNKEKGATVLFYSKCDEVWYRATIKESDVSYKDNFIQIFLLDYGESKCVNVKDLIPIPDVFKSQPPFAKRCHLYGILPVGNEQNKTLTWEREASEKMIALTENFNKFKITMAPNDQHHSFESLSVLLWLPDEDKCVNELLVKGKCAVQDTTAVHATFSVMYNDLRAFLEIQKTNLENWNPMKEDHQSYINTYELNVTDPAAVIYNYVGHDYDRICMHYARTGNCYKGETCKKEHTRLDRLGFTSDKEEVYRSAFNLLPPLQPGSLYSVQITCILDLNVFCCFTENPGWSGDDENLHTLVEYMNLEENIRDMKKLLIPPSTGQMVLGQYTQDDSWYRGRVLESQPENDIYTVNFVDYGNTEDLPLSRIRAIEPRYLHLPFQAVHCRIFGIEANPKIPSKEGIEYLNKLIGERGVNIEVISRYPGDDISLLVKVFDDKGSNIGADLIAKDYAIYKQEMIISPMSETVPG